MERSDYSEQVQTKRSTSKNPFPPPKRKINDNTKRFSDEQVKSLECMFNRGAKLEPRNKLQLAQDLGLQPRQVSIWFQNKRARWKSKKMEQEYRILKANFDALYQQFESLKQDKESLLEQLQTLNSLLEDPHRRHSSRNRDSFENGIKTAPANIDKYIEYRENNERAMNLDVDRVDINIYDGQKEEPELLISEQGDRSTASQKEWCNLVSSGPSDEPCCPSNWWDF